MDVRSNTRNEAASGSTAPDDVLAPEVLLLDDNVTSLAVLSAILKKEGYACVTADSAIAALDLAESHDTIKVVVTDIYMPGMDGFEFAKALKQSCAHGPGLQIVMLTGRPDVEAAVDALRLGACDFLSKPVAPTKIIESVGDAMQRARQQPKAPPAAALPLEGVVRDAQRLVTQLQALDELQAASPKGPTPPEQSVLNVAIIMKQAMYDTGAESVDECDWSYLLELARAVEEGRELTTTGLMLAVNSSSTTALRRINRLWHRGFIVKDTDSNDRRRQVISLSPKSQKLVSSFLQAASRQTGLGNDATRL